MKKKYLIFAIISVLAFVAILTNPNPDRHKEVIKNKLHLYMQKSMKENLTETNNGWEQAGQTIGMMLGGVLIDRIIDNLVSTDSYVLFSTSKINWDGQTKIIGIGAFGNVYVTDKLDEAIHDQLK